MKFIILSPKKYAKKVRKLGKHAKFIQFTPRKNYIVEGVECDGVVYLLSVFIEQYLNSVFDNEEKKTE